MTIKVGDVYTDGNDNFYRVKHLCDNFDTQEQMIVFADAQIKIEGKDVIVIEKGIDKSPHHVLSMDAFLTRFKYYKVDYIGFIPE